MITVHHLNNSRSQRVLWLLEVLGLSYEVMRYGGRIGAIVEYVVDKYGAGRLIPPAGTAARLRYTFWLHYAEGSALPPLLFKLMFDRVATTPMPWPFSAMARQIAASVQRAFIGPQLKRHLDFMESELAAPSTIHIDS